MERILLFVILILIGILIFNRGSIESFDDFFNPIQNIANITRPPPISAAQIQAASKGITTKNQQYLGNVYEQPPQVESFALQTVSSEPPTVPTGATVDVGTLASQSPDFTIAQTVCEPTNTADCNAFDREEFRKNCGISFDIANGTNSKGDPHFGGLYMDPVKKAQLMEAQKRNPTKSYTFGPLYGSVGPGLFAHDKPTCKYIQDDLKCKASLVVGTDNCSVCFSDFSYHATDPANPNEELTFVFYTNATELSMYIDTTLYFLKSNNTSYKMADNVAQDSTIISVGPYKLTTVSIKQVPVKEGQLIAILGSNKNGKMVLGGYVQASTANGEFKIDINIMIDKDGGKPPSVAGDVNGYTLYKELLTKSGPAAMILTGSIPFTFKGADTPDSRFNCSNAPFITTKGAMDYIATNEPCYGPDAKPGKYKLECLQQIFLASGGTNKGTGYPGTQETAQVLLVDENGTARSLDKIGKFLYGKMVLASTGLKDGQKMSMDDWNEASMYMTGTPKAGPCDTAEGEPLSTECLASLYMSSGCFPKGKLNPDPAAGNPMNEGVAAGMSMGGDQGKRTVAAVYKNAKDYANSPEISNITRKRAYMDCYGIPMLQTARNLALYVSIDGPGYINMSQLVVKDNNGDNVAKGGDTSKTTGGIYDGHAGGTGGYNNAVPGNAVDGVEAVRPYPQIYHSNSTNNPWFTVKLTKPSVISEIIYYGRGDLGGDRNQKYIKIWDQQGQSIWQSPRMTTENIQKFTIPMSVFEKPPPKMVGRVTVGGFGYIGISQLVVKDINGVNVARGGDTSKTIGGTYYGAGGDPAPSFAVDGTETARYFPYIYHSQLNDNTTLFDVTLTTPSIVTQIVVYGRLGGCCPERNQQIITLYDSVTNKPLWKSPRMSQETVQTFNIPSSIFQS